MIDSPLMGEFGHLECTAGCDHLMAFLHVGAGMAAVRVIKRCAECGQVTDVLAAHLESGEVVDASGRGRCPDCGSQRLCPRARRGGVELGAAAS